MPSLAALAGLARSVAIYYGRPGQVRRLSAFYAAFVGNGAVVFDVGAHVGSRSRALARLGSRVIAIEPQPLFAGFLRRTLPPGVLLRTEAVGSRPGRTVLAVSSRHPTVSSLSPGWISKVSGTDGFEAVRWDGAVEVDVTTLDALIEEYGMPRLVKIDVEGMEAEIVAGLSQPVPIISIEYLPAALDVAHAAIERLARLGPYLFNRVVGEEMRFAGEWMDAAEIRETLDKSKIDGRSGDVYAVLSGELLDECFRKR
jgi:FkbM family methyltransferase